jgi:DNA-binding NarL/FixJ family response regulator
VKNPIRIIIAEDHPIMQEALRNLIAKEQSIELVAEAKDGEEALALIEQLRPEIVLLDISMGRPDAGFEVASRQRERKLPVKTIFMSGQDYSEAVLRDFVRRARELDAAGFVLKAGSSAEIIDSIKQVADGRQYFSGRLTPYLIDLRDRAAAIKRQFPGLAELTEKERQILPLLSEAKTSKEIAAELGVSHRTVENHLSDIRGKLGLKGHNHLLKFAIEHKAELLITDNSGE